MEGFMVTYGVQLGLRFIFSPKKYVIPFAGKEVL
jgi:hypothetical protein